VFAALAIATTLKLALALTTRGTSDVVLWSTFLEGLRQFGPLALYTRERIFEDRYTEVFNHPPFMVHVLHWLGSLTIATGLPFPFWLRVPAIVADIGIVLLTWHFLRERPHAVPKLVALACAPAALMISGFHGNTDPVMIFFILLAAWCLARNEDSHSLRSVLLGGLAFGMALNIKAVPLLLVPLFFFYLSTLRARFGFFAAAAAIIGAGSLPYLLVGPETIVRRILSYGSFYGTWGLPRLFSYLPFTWLDQFYQHDGKFVALGAVTFVAWFCNRGTTKPPLFLQCGLAFFVFLALAPGFGSQYLAWLMPWIVSVGLIGASAYYLSSGAYLCMLYGLWYNGFPGLFAGGMSMQWYRVTILTEFACWLVVCLLCARYCQLVFPAAVGLNISERYRRVRVAWVRLGDGLS